MLYGLSLFVIVFFIYSFIGYIIEIVLVSKIEGKLVLSRGYLIGPYLPIFGIGGLIMIGYLSKYQNDVVALFVMSVVSSALLEYLTSLLLEKLFKFRWWDYSNDKFNVNGRICLKNSFLFGIAGIVFVKYINPLLIGLLFKVPEIIIIIIGIIIFIIMFADFCFSTWVIVNLKIKSIEYSDKDSTEMIRKEIKKSLEKYKFFHVRIFEAFPNIIKNKKVYKIKEIFDIRKKKEN